MRGPRRVAIVHEWLVTYAGSERVLEQMLAVYPDADLFAVCDFLPPDDLRRAIKRLVPEYSGAPEEPQAPADAPEKRLVSV